MADLKRAGAAGDVTQLYVDVPGDGSYYARKIVVVNADGTAISGGGGSSGTQYAQGATATTATGTLIMYKTGTTLTAVTTSAPLPVDGSSVTQPVSVATVPTHAVTQSGTWTVQPGNTANTTAWKVDGSAVTQPVSLSSVPSHAVTNAGTFAVQAASAGDTAHGATDGGNPVKVGYIAVAGVSGATLVSAAQRANAVAGLDGVPYMRPHAGLEDLVSGVASTTSNSATQVVAGVASTKQYLTSVTISNTSGTNTEVDILSSATVRWTFPTGTNGVTHSFNVPLAPNAAGDPWKFQTRAATSTVTVSVAGFKSKI